MHNFTELTCRVCLQEQEILIHVFEELEDFHTTLSKLLETCGGLQVDSEDAFPKYLCEECTGELLIAAKFRDKCVKSKEKLCDINKGSDLIDEHSCDAPFKDIIEYSSDVGALAEVDMVNGNDTTESVVSQSEDSGLEHAQVNCDQSLPRNCQTANEENIIKSDKCPEVPSSTTIVTCFSVTADDEPPEYIIKYSPIANESCNYEIATDTVSDNELVESTSSKSHKKNTFKCDICGAVFVQAINLQKHLQKLHAPVECFSCAICEHWFTLKSEVMKHESICKETTLSDNYKKRRKYHTTPKEPTIDSQRNCIYCGRDFQTPFALKMHLRTHTGERPFSCQLCNKAFKTQSSLNVHIKRHAGQADFKCSVCGKSFFEKGNLAVHMRTHTGERPHVCTLCQKTFTRVFLLELHMRTHTGEKPFACSYCDRSFSQRTDLKSHISTHTGIKKYNCSLCKKGYVKRASLVQHNRYQHPLQNAMQQDELQSNDELNKSDLFNALDYITDAEESC